MGKNNLKKFSLSISGVEEDLIQAVALRVIELTQPDFFKNQEQKFTVREASRLLDIKEQSVRKHINKGILPAIKIGKSWRINESDLKNYLNGK